MFHLVPALICIYVIIQVNVIAATTGKVWLAGSITVGLLILILGIVLDYTKMHVKRALAQKENQTSEEQETVTMTPVVNAQEVSLNTPRNTPAFVDNRIGQNIPRNTPRY